MSALLASLLGCDHPRFALRSFRAGRAIRHRCVRCGAWQLETGAWLRPSLVTDAATVASIDRTHEEPTS